MARRRSGGKSARLFPRRAPPPEPGMAFGTGNAVAHRAVDAVMGPRTIKHETVVSEAAAASVPTATSMGGSESCGMQSKAFQDCLNSFGDEISKCQSYMDMLADCRKNPGSTSMMSS